MKLVRKARLYLKEGTSDKVYEVDLCRLSEGRYVVNFRYGRRGGYLREGTKTVTAVELPEAEKIFDSIVVAKTNKGYREAGRPEAGAEQPPGTVALDGDNLDGVEKAALDRLREAVEQANKEKIQRAAWRIGELAVTAAVPDLMALIPADNEMIDYCVAWALGRCGDERALPVLERLGVGTGSEAVRRIVAEAKLATANEEQRVKIIADVARRLPPAVHSALAENDADLLADAAGSAVTVGGPESMALLERLYYFAAVNPCARAFVLSALGQIPFKPGHFKAIRHIYKMAEFRLDAEIIGLLALRFETEKACFYIGSGMDSTFLPGTWEYVRLKSEVSKPKSRLAFSNRTRNYFRRRVWRLLRRMGKAEDDRYVALAGAVLLAFDDNHAGTPKTSTRYLWQQGEDGRWQSVPDITREYGPYGGYLSFNHILHENSRNHRLSPNGLSWLTVSDHGASPSDGAAEEAAALRQEAFPHLWDRHPGALLKLLNHSRCEPVHDFAARALGDNTSFCDQITTEQIRLLLAKPYAATVQLGLNLATSHYDPDQPDVDLLAALLSADLEAARQLARQWIDDRVEILLEAAGLMTDILTSRHEDIRQWGCGLVPQVAFTDGQVEGLIARMVAFLMSLEDGKALNAAVVPDAAGLFLGPWAEHCRRMDIGVISDLLHHPLAAVQSLAGQLLLQHSTPPAELPPELIRYMIDADSEDVQGMGVQLFSRLPEQWLLCQADLIHNFCTSETASVRRGVLPIVQQLAASDPEFGRNLFDRLFPSVFRKAASPEQRQDLVALLSEGLASHCQRLDAGTKWRLLQARALGARQLGATLLAQSDAHDFTVRQWARLGTHSLLAVRQWCWKTYGDGREDIADNMMDGLCLLDSHWDDTRQFGFDYFREGFNADHWRPELLVSICDSVREDVQQFGRELITTFFEQRHGEAYLLQLSQHPSTNVQLFASNFLEAHAGSDMEKLRQLTPYFTTVLSQVNCGRVAKARIFDYLHRLAVASAEGAALVAPICNRISATMAIGDRGTCVRILHDIQRTYPQVETLLEPVPVSRRPIGKVEVDHAV